MPWFVIYTKSRNEKKVADELLKLGIEAYSPMVTKIRVWSDRKKKVSVPLINSYVFVQLAESDRNSIFLSSGVVRYLFWLGKPAIVKNFEIESIKNWLSHSDVFDVVVEVWKKGDKIVVDPSKVSRGGDDTASMLGIKIEDLDTILSIVISINTVSITHMKFDT